MNKQEKLTEEEKIQILTKKLMRIILVLVLVVVLGIGVVVYYFADKYNSEKNSQAEPKETALGFTQYNLIVRIDPDVDDQSIYEQILGIDNVASATLETKEEAFEKFKESLGEDASVLDGLEADEFLRSSVKIILKSNSKEADTIAELEKIQGVAEVDTPPQLSETQLMILNILNRQ